MPFRRSWGALAAVLFAAAATPVHAAHETAVADAMDEDHPLEVDLEARFTHERRLTRISRENVQVDPASGKRGISFVDELQHSETVDQLELRLGLGLWHDLELHVLAPLVLRDFQEWNYATVNGASVAPTSTLAHNTIDISGCAAPGSCTAVNPVLPLQGQSLRAGFRDPTLGIAWGPINEEREQRLRPELYPPGHALSTWVIGFDYTLPLPGNVDDPSRFGVNSAVVPGQALVSRPLFRKTHVFSAWTSFSKRFAVLEPYVTLRGDYGLPIQGAGAGDGAYDNCWHPEQLADVATQNCKLAAWQGKTGLGNWASAALTLGTELVAAEDVRGHRRLSFDVRTSAQWFSQARTYTQVSDALGKLTHSEEFARLGGSVGVVARAARWVHFRLAGTLAVDTPHLLTSEEIGRDLDGDGQITVSAGSSTKSQEQNPVYDFRVDQVGRRLRAEPALAWGVTGELSLNF